MPIVLAGRPATEWCHRSGSAIEMSYGVSFGAESVRIQYTVKEGDTRAAQGLSALEWTE